jgi:RNA polymerase sigma-70 factor (ECF subfamily)
MPTQELTEIKTRLAIAHSDYEKRLHTYAFYKVSDKTVSEDLVQDTFLKTWIYLVKGGKVDMMKAFLYHILNNLIIDEYRKHKPASLDVMLEKGYEPGVTDTERDFNIFDGKAALLLIMRLPVKYQKVMRMRYVQDLTLDEMSLITGQSKNAMAVQTHRGLEKLKVLYKGVK